MFDHYPYIDVHHRIVKKLKPDDILKNGVLIKRSNRVSNVNLIHSLDL